MMGGKRKEESMRKGGKEKRKDGRKGGGREEETRHQIKK